MAPVVTSSASPAASRSRPTAPCSSATVRTLFRARPVNSRPSWRRCRPASPHIASRGRRGRLDLRVHPDALVTRSRLPCQHREAPSRSSTPASGARRARLRRTGTCTWSKRCWRAPGGVYGWTKAARPRSSPRERLVGVTFDPGGALVTSSNDAVYGFSQATATATPTDDRRHDDDDAPVSPQADRRASRARRRVTAGAEARARRRRSGDAGHRRGDRGRHLRSDRPAAAGQLAPDGTVVR